MANGRGGTKPKLPTQSASEQKQDTSGKPNCSFQDDVEIKNEDGTYIKDFKKLKEHVIEKATELLKNKRNIENFKIGKTSAKRGDSDDWDDTKLKNRRYDTSYKGYDSLIAFAVITRDNVPENT